MDELRATRTFKVNHVTPDPTRRARGHHRGRARVGVVIPPDFHDKRARDDDAKVLVLDRRIRLHRQLAGARRGQRRRVQGHRRRDPRHRRAASSPGRRRGSRRSPIILFNPDGRTANYIIPGLVAVMLQMVATMLTAIAIVREREQGTLEQLLVTPIDPLGLMLGKVVPYLVHRRRRARRSS